jgi:hypothetical protein
MCVARLEELLPSYNAVQALLSTFSDVTKSTYTHHPNHGRTDGIILLETEIDNNYDILCHLFTPFGRFRLFDKDSLPRADQRAASSKFLEKIGTSLKDVTTDMVIRDVPFKFKHSHYFGGAPTRISLVTAVQDASFKLAEDTKLIYYKYKLELGDDDILFEDISKYARGKSSK